MTDNQLESKMEYIITGTDIKTILFKLDVITDTETDSYLQIREILKDVQHHPHHPVPEAPCPQNKIWQHCPLAEQIQQSERKEVCDKLKQLIDNSKEYGSQDRQELFHYTGLYCMIESLRGEVK